MANTYSIDFELDNSEYAKAADNADISVTGDITIEMWIKLDQLPSSVGTAFDFFEKWKDDDPADKSYAFLANSNNTLSLYWSHDGTANTNITSSGTLGTENVGVWTHIAVALDVSTKAGTFYKDAGAIGGALGAGTSESINDGAATLEIGAHTETATNRYMDGRVDDVRLWDDIRTATEISDNYQSELQGNEANLVGYWKFNDGTGTTAADSSSNSTTLDLVNTPGWGTDVPFSGAAERAGLDTTSKWW
jgi:hypothetical protein